MVHEVYHGLMRRLLASALCAAMLIACHYDLSLTPEPTRNVDARLLGTWTLMENGKPERMEVRKYDDANYVIAYDNGEVYRAFHSDAAGMSLVSVQNLNDSERKWVFLSWDLSKDGHTLTLRAIDTNLIENGDRAAMVKAIEANRDNPKLFGEPGVYRK